jgi:hypothetical protein
MLEALSLARKTSILVLGPMTVEREAELLQKIDWLSSDEELIYNKGAVSGTSPQEVPSHSSLRFPMNLF